jgi:hypothetical protein
MPQPCIPAPLLQRAKLLWSLDRPQRAIAEVQRKLASLQALQGQPRQQAGRAAAAAGSGSSSATQGRAKLALQLARWTAETGTSGKEVLTKLYEEAIDSAPRWEKGHFEYARYLDQLYVVGGGAVVWWVPGLWCGGWRGRGVVGGGALTSCGVRAGIHGRLRRSRLCPAAAAST